MRESRYKIERENERRIVHWPRNRARRCMVCGAPVHSNVRFCTDCAHERKAKGGADNG